MKIQGFAADRSVRVDGTLLSPDRSQRVRNHSPDGFSWGYGGSGPSQLALALCLASGVPVDDAQRHYQKFKFQIVAAEPMDQDFDIDVDVAGWLAGQERARHKAFRQPEEDLK